MTPFVQCSFDISTANVMTEREGVIYQTMSNLSSIFVSKKVSSLYMLEEMSLLRVVTCNL